MRKLLKSIRRIRWINYSFRNIFRWMGKFQDHWPLSGNINCRFEDIHFKIYTNCDDHIPERFYYNIPFHEDIVLKTMKLFARRAACIADIGANTGFHSIVGALSNPACKIYSVEPYAPNYLRLEHNIALNKCTNITVIKNALGNKHSELKFFIPSDNSVTDVSSAVDTHGNSIYPEIKWKETTVNQITFDELYQQTGKIDFFKCDVEGFEKEVIDGAKNFFRENRPDFIIEIGLDEEKCNFFNEFARENGYNIYLATNYGLYYLESLYSFDRWENFIFTSYKDKYPFIPFKDLEEFVTNCTSNSNRPSISSSVKQVKN